jgi:acetolactate synthase-1/2/3 large subunit
MLDTPGPVIFDCVVPKDENCFPMIPSGKAHNEMILAGEPADVEVSEEGKALV